MLAWPKLIGLCLAAFAVAGVISIADRITFFAHSLFVAGLGVWSVFAVSCFFLALSFPLYRGCNWARLVLVGIVLLAAIVVVWFSVADVTRQHLAVDGDATKITPEEIRSIQREELVLRLTSAGSALAVLVPLGFLVCVLTHSDVVGAFSQAPTRHDPKT